MDADEFLVKLRRIVERVYPGARAETEQALDQLVQAGATSFRGLLAVLRDPRASLETRLTACWLAGQLGSRRAVPALLAVLRDQDPRLRAEAARQLGYLHSPLAIGPLIASSHDSDVEVQKAAVYALGYVRGSQAFEALEGALADTRKAPEVRGMAAEQLARFHDKRAIGRLLGALRDNSVDVRFWAAYALGVLGAAEALPELERLATTDEAVLPGWWSVSHEARDAMASIKARQSQQ